MKKFILAAVLSLFVALSAHAEKPKPVENFTETLSKATLAVYRGKQTCGYEIVDTFFGPLDVWGCKFESHFTCTATVVVKDGRGDYVGLTDGHCFPYAALEKGWQFYVSDKLSDKPVLNRIILQKFENDDRYDYAVFTFNSSKDYPAIEIEKGAIPGIGTEVENVNFSLGIAKQVVEGKVLSNQVSGHEGETEDLKGRFFSNLPIGPGASGSAVVDKKTHKIIGMVELSFPGTQMAIMVVPMGEQFQNFMEDASAGIAPRKSAGPAVKFHEEPVAPKAPVHVPTIKELIWELVKRLARKLLFWRK